MLTISILPVVTGNIDIANIAYLSTLTLTYIRERHLFQLGLMTKSPNKLIGMAKT